MIIYFSGAIAGGRNDVRAYTAVVNHLQALGHHVPTAHVADPTLDAQATGITHITPVEAFHFDLKWLRECDAVVAEVTTPSFGVGYELAYALGRGKPVLALRQAGVNLSWMLLGNDEPTFALRSYGSEEEMLKIVDEFLVGACAVAGSAVVQ